MLEVLGLLKTRNLDGTAGESVMYRERGGEFVEKMLCGLRRHIAVPFRYTLLTDRPRPKVNWYGAPAGGIDYREVPLKGDHHGWWAKLQIFDVNALDLDVGQRALYLDLDNVVLGNVAPLMTRDIGGPMMLADDVHVRGLPNGSVIAFDPVAAAHAGLWERYLNSPRVVEQLYDVWPHAADQAYIAAAMRRRGTPVKLVQDVFGPRSIVHIEDELLKGIEPDETTMLLQGRWKAKPWLVDHPVIKREWRC